METSGIVSRLDLSGMLKCPYCLWFGSKDEAVRGDNLFFSIYSCPTCGKELSEIGSKVY